MSDEFKVTLDNASTRTLDDYIHDIRLVWRKHDPERSIYDMWLHTINHGSKFGEEVRRGRIPRVLDELADVIMWFLTFVGRLQESPDRRHITIPHEQFFFVDKQLTEIVWNKYPNLCPVCFFRLHEDGDEDQWWGRGCECILNISQVETRNEILSVGDDRKRQNIEALGKYVASDSNRARIITKVNDLQDMFARIFQANIQNSSLESIAFHLLEEMGEVSDALLRTYTYSEPNLPSPRRYAERIINLENELADIVSWIFAVTLKVKQLYETYDGLFEPRYRQAMTPEPSPVATRINLWEVLWRGYGHPSGNSLWCPHCEDRYCKCPLVFANDLSEITSQGS